MPDPVDTQAARQPGADRDADLCCQMRYRALADLDVARAALDAAVAERDRRPSAENFKIAKDQRDIFMARAAKAEAKRDALQERIDKALAIADRYFTGFHDHGWVDRNRLRAVLVDDKGDNQQ